MRPLGGGQQRTSHRAERSGRATGTPLLKLLEGCWDYYRTHRAEVSHCGEGKPALLPSGDLPPTPLALPQERGRRHTGRSSPWQASTEGDRTAAPHPGPPAGSGQSLHESTGDQREPHQKGVTSPRAGWLRSVWMEAKVMAAFSAEFKNKTKCTPSFPCHPAERFVGRVAWAEVTRGKWTSRCQDVRPTAWRHFLLTCVC